MTHLQSNLLLDDKSNYSSILYDFWAGNFKKVLDVVTSKILNESTSKENNPSRWYRLWIETLASQGARLSLSELNSHLFIRSCDDSANLSWLGLRGLIHLELDEYDACELIANTLSQANDIYSIEFKQRWSWRKTENANFTELSIIDTLPKLKQFDYFYFQTLLRSLLLSGFVDEIDIVLTYLRNLIPNNPEYDLYFIYKNIDSFAYINAFPYCESLVKIFPQHSEYHFLTGYVYMQGNRIDQAIAHLEKAKKLSTYDDPDHFATLAYCYYKKSQNDPTNPNWNQAIEFYQKTKQVLQKLGLPITEICVSLNYLISEQNRVKHGKTVTNTPNPWVIILSQRRYAEFNMYDERDIEYLYRAMGRSVENGDIVFICGEPVLHKSELPLIAVYTVCDAKIPHPIEKDYASLQLTEKLVNPIHLDSSILELSKRGANLPQGTYKLSENAFDSITQLIKRYNDNSYEVSLESQKMARSG